MRRWRGCSAAARRFTKASAASCCTGPVNPIFSGATSTALKKPKEPPLLAEIAGPDAGRTSDPNLKAALDHAFEEPAAPPFRRTKAVVVVRDGRVVAERYANGIGVDTPLLGFSMTKSVINALIGILTQQGLVSPSMPAPIPEWRGAYRSAPRDRGRASDAHDTGLALDETNSGFDPSSQMVYLHDDMAAFAVKAADDCPAGNAMGVLQPDHTVAGADHPRHHRWPREGAGLRVARAFQSAGNAQRDAGIRWRRHPAGIDLYAGKRPGLGALRIALSE